MKNFVILFFILVSMLCTAQNTTVDIDEQTQNRSLAIFIPSPPEIMEYDFSGINFIDIDYKIPAFGLYNGLWDNDHLRSAQIDIPFSDGGLKIILLESHNTPFVFPCRGTLSLFYGKTKRNIFHTGVDFLLQENDPIYACFDGVVRMAHEYGDYGKIVVIRHYNGLETVYTHLNKLQVRENQIIKAGYTIGFAGKTGNTQEVLLHFETRFLNEHFNPALMINFDTRTLYSNILTLTPADFSILPIPSSFLKQEKNSHEKDEYFLPATNTGSMPTITAILQIPPQTPQKETSKYHIVKKGETLYHISNQYDISIDKLMKINNLKNADQIQVGKKLVLKL